MKNKLHLFLYYTIFRKIPVSHTIMGKIAMYFRYKSAKIIFKKCSIGVNIEKGAYFGKGKEIEIGDYSGIGINCRVPPNIKIGKFVMMGKGVIIYNVSHNFDNIEIPMYYQGSRYLKQLTISDDVWIGSNVIILPKVERIGRESIIGAGSVVTKSVPDFAIVGGNPA